MTAFNIVRMRAKPGRDQELLKMSQEMDRGSADRMKSNGFRRGAIVKTGERSYCFVGE
jgi:hypothetical protein